jgi:uncharacterized OB-fold protein
MNSTISSRPRPLITTLSEPYWTGLKSHKLLIQRCKSCLLLRHYPRPMCDACHSMQFDWKEVSGAGLIYSWTVCHHTFHPAFSDDAPYTLLTVQLEEGPRLVAPFRHSTPLNIRLGLPVRAGFEVIDKELTLPFFKPA